MSTTTKRALAIGLGVMTAAALGTFVVACQGADEEAAAVEEERLPVAAERLAEELELDDAQRAHLETIRDMAHEHRDGHVAEREEHFAKLRAAVATGEVDDQEVHSRIDQKAHEITALAHRVADELIGLVRSLEPAQRERAVERLDRVHERMQAFHEEMESGEAGPGGLFARMHARRCGGGPIRHLLEE